MAPTATLNSTGSLPHVTPTSPSGLTDSPTNTILFIFYLAGLAGLIIQVTSGLVLIRTQYALQAILCQKAAASSSSSSTKAHQPAIHTRTTTDPKRALRHHNLAATAVMKRARSFALFGPLATIPTLLAIPTSLHLNSVGDVSIRAILSVLLIAIVHCANACTFQTYFSLVRKQTGFCFGPKICCARQEKRRSTWLLKVYLTLLFCVSCPLQSGATDERDVVVRGWEPSTTTATTTYGAVNRNSPYPLPRFAEDFSDTDSIDSIEIAKRMV